MSSRYPTATEREQRRVLSETLRVLTHWAPKWRRSKDRAMEVEAESTGLEQSHPEWIHPDMRQVVTHFIVLAGLPCIMITDALLIGAVSEYIATMLFPHSSTLIAVARFCLPVLLVGVEIVIAVLTASASEKTVWDGSRAEYKLFTKIGWGMVTVTPLMVIAALLTGIETLTVEFIILACAQVLFGALLHLMVVKGGQWIREATAFALFRTMRTALRIQLRRAEVRVDFAAEQIRIAYPAFEVSYSSFVHALPSESSIGRHLPVEVMSAIEHLFGSERCQRLPLPDRNAVPIIDDIAHNDIVIREKIEAGNS